MDQKTERTIAALKKNNYEVYFAEDRAEAKKLALGFIKEGDSVGVGGSATLDQLEMIPALRSEKYRFCDRYTGDPAKDDKARHDALSADVFLTSANAVTESGELYNVDGTGNRVSALIFGPKTVVVIAGVNKLVPDMEAAILRVKTEAAPKNCVRLKQPTYCSKTGHCLSIDQGKGTEMKAGCDAPCRICLNYVICGYQRVYGRIKVIIVNEELGF